MQVKQLQGHAVHSAEKYIFLNGFISSKTMVHWLALKFIRMKQQMILGIPPQSMKTIIWNQWTKKNKKA